MTQRCRHCRRNFNGLMLGCFLLAALAVAEVTEAASVLEKNILLEFKSGLASDPRDALASWVSSSDPCLHFAGVTCDPVTGSVQRIVIHGADLDGTLSPSLAQLSALQALSLFGNRFTGEIPPGYAVLAPTLHKLNLSRNDMSGSIPAFLGSFVGLRLLDLSYNSFSGEIPPQLFQTCAKIRFISFAHNELIGPVPKTIGNCSNLAGFDFSFNNLTGEFPSRICDPPAVNYVSVRSNALSGTVADKISACKSLNLFDVADNHFSGPAPFDLIRLVNITYFNVSANKFTGAIPAIAACADGLWYLDASDNGFTGEIPASIANCRNLRLLDLGTNNLHGGIPADLGRLQSLSVLRLGSNEGISGVIPAELAGLPLLQVLQLDSLELTGAIPSSLSQCRFLLELNLSGNQLQGEIPDTLDNLTYLKVLDLHRNQLTGSIPAIIGNLINLKDLDLSDNKLSGPIPPSLGNLANLTHFNVSYNNLSGIIPSAPVLEQFGPPAFMNNPLLCGPPLKGVCGGTPRGVRRLSTSVIVVIVATAVIFVGVCMVMAMNIRVDKRIPAQEVLVSESTPMGSNGSSVIIGKLVLFSKTLPSRYEDWEAGTKALLDKDCLIGGGSIGTVYKVNFDGGVATAVKKLETLGTIRNQDEFEHEMSRLGNLSHPNLVGFQGYYWSSTMQLLLFEFLPRGSLFDHLHGTSYPSDYDAGRHDGRGGPLWARRFKIALGTARALAHLHHDCRPQILHLNIKSSNILLTEDYEAKLSDYGLEKLLPILGSFDLAKFHTAVGYVAPELASQSLRYSDKCDVYSFGVVLLEIVTGRKPVESPGAGRVLVLRDHVRGALEEGTVADCFDRRLRGSTEAELIQTLKLGLMCSSDDPTKRPRMAEVIQFLESVRTNS